MVIIDAMFLINTRPLRSTKTITDYAILLFHRFATEYFKAGADEVHFIFDKHTCSQQFYPKKFEQERRDSSKLKKQHEHTVFTTTTPVPQCWNDYISCRVCKRSIIEAIGLSYLQRGLLLLRNRQVLVLAGCFQGGNEDSAWVLHGQDYEAVVTAEPDTQYLCNAIEADMRIWRHAITTWATRVLIYSPDTDVYNVGLSLHIPKEIILQLNVPHSQDKKFLNFNNLILALKRDPDLSTLPKDQLSCILQTLYVCTGCDFVSYFRTLGKAGMLQVFFQYSQFICGGGSLSNNADPKESFPAFLRLVGSCYFKKHLAAFISLFKSETPSQLFNTMDPTMTKNERHELWLRTIRTTVADRIGSEEERVPSYTALWRHWLRSCYVCKLWKNSPLSNVYDNLPRPEDSGWISEGDGRYQIDWEDPKVAAKIKSNIDFLLKGCNCKKGCTSKKCGCRKKSNYCGPGCECQGCSNLPVQIQQEEDRYSDDDDDEEEEEDSDIESDSSDDASDSCEELLETEIITDELFFTTDII